MLKFRPHHFLCTLGFQGKGYSPNFVDNFIRIKQQLESPCGDETLIEVTNGQDQICQACPLDKGKRCQNQEKIVRLDHAHKTILDLHWGQRLTWGEAKSRMQRLISSEKFNQICDCCYWKNLGICRKALLVLTKRYVTVSNCSPWRI